MAKRFTASDKWEDNWFRKLPLKSKLFWLFILDRCDVAGIWKIDYELASFCIGEQITNEILKDFTERIEELDRDKLWIVKFIEFQYGYLSKEANPHKSVIKLLKKYGLLQRVMKGLVKGCQTLKDKDKDKDKDKKRKGESEGKTKPLLFDSASPTAKFEVIWAKYPERVGKKEALRHFNASVKTEEDWEDINKALENYLQSERVAVKGYIQDGKTWFNNWKDWRKYKKPVFSIPEDRFKDDLPAKKPELTKQELKQIHEDAERLKREIREKQGGKNGQGKT